MKIKHRVAFFSDLCASSRVRTFFLVSLPSASCAEPLLHLPNELEVKFQNVFPEVLQVVKSMIERSRV